MNRSPISVSTVAYDGYPLATALSSIQKLGFHVVEIAYIKGYSEGFDEAVFSDDNATNVRRLLETHGLTCRTLSAHMDTSTADALEALRRRVIFARSIGASFVATNTGPAANRSQFLANLRAIAVEAADAGLIVAIENPGDGIDAIINDGASGCEVVGVIDHPAVRMNYDFGNLMSHRQGKVDPAKDFIHALPVTVHYHIKDVVFRDQQWDHAAIGAGQIEYAEIFRYLDAYKIEIPLSIEAPTRLHRFPTGRPFISEAPLPLADIERLLDQSRRYIAKQLADTGAPPDFRKAQ